MLETMSAATDNKLVRKFECDMMQIDMHAASAQAVGAQPGPETFRERHLWQPSKGWPVSLSSTLLISQGKSHSAMSSAMRALPALHNT